MEQKPDWANIEDEESDGEYDEQEQQDERQEKNEGKQGESQGDTRTGDSRPPGYRGGRGGQRGSRGTRGGRGGNRGGARNDQRDRVDKPQGPKQSQPKNEMMSIIKNSNERTILINLFNVDYNAKEDDIQNIYHDVKIIEINQIKAGIFLLELEKDEALNLVNIGAKEVNGRPFFMKMGYSNKKQHPDEQWHHVNAANHKHHLGHREDRTKRGGGDKPYNRREQNDLRGGDFLQRKPYNKDRPNRDQQNQEPMDPENKFFKGHDLTSNEFNIRFTKSNSSTKKDEGNEAQAKASKPNPFGGAVPRDENEYLKKKEEEKSQVKDLQEHFEEKKEELQKDSKNLPTPVNSPNTEFVEGVEKEETDKPKIQGPPGFSGKGQKKSGFEKQDSKKKPVEQPKGDKPKGKATNKANVFDLLAE